MATYNFRTRVGVATQAGESRIDNLITDTGAQNLVHTDALHPSRTTCPSEITRGTISLNRAARPTATMRTRVGDATSDLTIERPSRYYSDVVASRPPSLALTTEGAGACERNSEARVLLCTTARNQTRIKNAVCDDLVSTGTLLVNTTGATVVRNKSELEYDSLMKDRVNNADSDESEDSNPWITVDPRRSRSLDSLIGNFENYPSEYKHAKKLMTAKETFVNKAKNYNSTAKVTATNKIRAAEPRVSERSTSPGNTGTSIHKRKGVDPRNWGSANLSNADTNIKAQRAALKTFEKRNINIVSTERVRSSQYDERRILHNSGHHKKGRELTEYSERRSNATIRQSPLSDNILRGASNRPANQIAPNSYLGNALREIDKKNSSRNHASRDYSSDSDPSSSNSSESGSDTESDDSSSSESDRYSRRIPRHRSRRRKRRRSKSKVTLIKPIPPKKYDGTADTRAYHRFITESTAYIEQGKVKRNKRIFLLSHYLTGKAYDFFAQKVSLNHRVWTLDEFFTGLFNYCFPVNFRMELREKLEDLLQEKKRVSEYLHELEELFLMIGQIDDREKVIKLWLGLWRPIQRQLWLNGYNPETSSWDEVIHGAEIIEISQNLPIKRAPNNYSESESGSGLDSDGESDRTVSDYDSENSGSEADHDEPEKDLIWQREARSSRANNRFIEDESSDNFVKQEHSTPRLSDRERAELMSAGHCFNCKVHGHLARDCPARVSIKMEPANDQLKLSNVQYIDNDTDDDELLYADSIYLGCIQFAGLVDSDVPQMYESEPEKLNVNRRAHLPDSHNVFNGASSSTCDGTASAPIFLEGLLNLLFCYAEFFNSREAGKELTEYAGAMSRQFGHQNYPPMEDEVYLNLSLGNSTDSYFGFNRWNTPCLLPAIPVDSSPREIKFSKPILLDTAYESSTHDFGPDTLPLTCITNSENKDLIRTELLGTHRDEYPLVSVLDCRWERKEGENGEKLNQTRSRQNVLSMNADANVEGVSIKSTKLAPLLLNASPEQQASRSESREIQQSGDCPPCRKSRTHTHSSLYPSHIFPGPETRRRSSSAAATPSIKQAPLIHPVANKQKHYQPSAATIAHNTSAGPYSSIDQSLPPIMTSGTVQSIYGDPLSTISF